MEVSDYGLMTLIDNLSRYVPGCIEEYYVKSQSELPVCWSKFEPSISRIKVYSYTHLLGKNVYSV
jgi:hypothetical protein